MNKIKKYIYPFAFSATFLIHYIALALLITKVISFPYGSYAPAALIALFTLAWVIFALPIYCIIYSKIIVDEKLWPLFSFCNSLLIIVAHCLPFNWQGEENILFAFSAWVILWNAAPLILRLISKKRQNGTAPEENNSHIINSLLQNKKKTIAAICITCLYITTLLTDNMVWQFYDFTLFMLYTLPLISAALVLVFLLLNNKEYILKKCLLPFALAGESASSLFSIYSGLKHMEIQLKHNPLYPVNFAISCLLLVLLALMFTGTLFNFKYLKLLKYGALAHAILSAVLLTFNLINLNGPAYQINSNGALTINTALVIASLVRALYFIGIFILTTNKTNANPEQ